MDIRPGDVLFVWGRSLLDDAIEIITNGPSHVAMFIDDKTLAEAQGFRHIGDIDLTFYTSSKDRLEIWRDETLIDSERHDMVEYARSQYGNRYDYALIPLELAHFSFNVPLSFYREHRRRICSTYVNDIADHVSRRWSDIDNPAPIDVMMGGALKRVYVWRNGAWVAINSNTVNV